MFQKTKNSPRTGSCTFPGGVFTRFVTDHPTTHAVCRCRRCRPVPEPSWPREKIARKFLGYGQFSEGVRPTSVGKCPADSSRRRVAPSVAPGGLWLLEACSRSTWFAWPGSLRGLSQAGLTCVLRSIGRRALICLRLLFAGRDRLVWLLW